MKLAAILFLLGGLELAPFDRPVLPAPPSPVARFDPVAYLADCTQLVGEWNRLQQLERELGR